MKKNILLAAALTSLTVGTASAATITWGSATTIASSTDVSTTGTAVYASYFSGVIGAPATTVVNGVTFDKQSTGSGNITFTSNPPTAGVLNTLIGAGSVSSPYSSILESSVYAIGTATLTGLTSGYTYQVQVWAMDQRYNNSQATTISGGPNLAIDNDSGSGSAGVGQFAIGTFTAGGSTQNIDFGSADAGIVNAISVRAIPEPSAALLGGLGVLALLHRRR